MSPTTKVCVNCRGFTEVSISINFLDNITQVSLNDLEEIFSILKNFSYQNEICLLTQMYTMSLITKRIVTPDEYSVHLRFDSYGNVTPINNPFK